MLKYNQNIKIFPLNLILTKSSSSKSLIPNIYSYNFTQASRTWGILQNFSHMSIISFSVDELRKNISCTLSKSNIFCLKIKIKNKMSL